MPDSNRKCSISTLLTVFAVVSLCCGISEAMLNGYNGLAVKNLKFSKACPEKGHRYHEETGNFLCVIHTAKECFEACQVVGCNEWFFPNMMSSKDTNPRPYHRCRCVPQFRLCLYNMVPAPYRDFDK